MDRRWREFVVSLSFSWLSCYNFFLFQFLHYWFLYFSECCYSSHNIVGIVSHRQQRLCLGIRPYRTSTRYCTGDHRTTSSISSLSLACSIVVLLLVSNADVCLCIHLCDCSHFYVHVDCCEYFFQWCLCLSQYQQQQQ